MEWIFITLASLLAGFVDAIVGGGGLVMVPALFAAFPGAPPATLLGTNKAASVWGTSMATWQYSRRVQIRWRAMLPAAAAGFAGSFAGAWAVTVMSADFLRKLLPLVLLAVLAYTLAKKELGRHHTPRFAGTAEAVAACVIGGVAIAGGVGTAVGALIGAVLLQTITFALGALGVSQFWQQAVAGALLVAAIAFDRIVAMRSTHRATRLVEVPV